MVTKKTKRIVELKGDTAQKEENASEKFWFPWKPFKNRTVLESLSIKRTQKKTARRGKKKREIPACKLHQPRAERPGCAPRRPAVPLVYTHNSISLHGFGLDPIVQ